MLCVCERGDKGDSSTEEDWVPSSEGFVLDEADRMMDMGFMPDVRRSVNDPNMPGKVRIHVQ